MPHFGEFSRRRLHGLAGGVLAGTVLGAPPVSAAPAAPEASGWLRDRMRTDDEWASFLAGQDLVWQRVPRTWYEGPFLGNGFLGVQVYREPGANALRFTVDHSEVQDHRPKFGNEWGVARLPVGRVRLTPVGEIIGVDLRLDLWNAELRGTVFTTSGELAIRSFVQAERDLFQLEVRPDGGEREFGLEFTPLPAVSPRTIREDPPASLTPNPPPVTTTEGELTVVVQPMVAGGQTATAYRVRRSPGGADLLLSATHSYPATDAEHKVRATVAEPADERAHHDWWHAFYRRSFLSIPDALLQSFYWIQLYKLASAARAAAPVMATTGPWIEPTPWPSVWWNLNAQLEYWPVYGSNHLELDPIPRTVRENQQVLVDGLRPEYRHDSMGLRRSTDARFADAGYVGVPNPDSDAEIGDLPWLMHNVWLTYRHTMDTSVLRDVLFPVLTKAVNYYLHFLHLGPDGRMHLPPTFSPEYGRAPDCNYDLALIRWSCATLLETAKILGVSSPLEPKWREVLDKLVDYPVDANGFMVGAGVPFAKSHRHYSHMLAVYPLYLVNAEQPGNRELIERSLEHWISFEGALRGYSFTGAASISAQLNRGDDALAHLREFVARFAQPNTNYYEAGPVIETPLSGAQSLHDMLCQSWGGVIRIFPAVPGAWADVTLHNFLAEGAFEVSAVRKGGSTTFVRVRSLAGQPLKLKPGIDGPLTVAGSGGRVKWTELPGGLLEIDLPKHAEVLVHRKGPRPDLVIEPVRTTVPAPPWGLPELPPGGASVPVDLTAFLTNDAITSEFYLGDGDFDGAGNTYPAAQLPQTGKVADDGIEFVFVNGHEGTPNNVVPGGAPIVLPEGAYGVLHLLGASDNGNTNTTMTITYTDGSTAELPLKLTDWRASAAFGESEAITASQLHAKDGPKPVKLAIFHQTIELDPARSPKSLTLPAAAKPRPHLFAITLEKG
ncbi:glycosyl hydrolase family 95 catalytic domain-containing protein [Amycolatopsis lurida]